MNLLHLRYCNLVFTLTYPWKRYLAWLHGQPVATALATYARGVVGIYYVVTLPAARRQGIGRAVTLAALLEARARGYRVAVLHSAEMGLSVYQRLGFTRYCVAPLYVWPHEPGASAAARG